MASTEFLSKRIEGKKAEITKLEGKLARIIKAQESGWTVNPYFYREDDLRWTNKDLEAARKALAEYEAKLAAETEKDASRNVQAIIDFLNTWADRVYTYHEKKFAEYLEACKDRKTVSAEYDARYWSKERYEAPAEWQAYKASYDEYRKAFDERWHFIYPYVECGVFNGAKLRKELEQDKKAKYDDIIERTNVITGKITDASGLSVGGKGELNGLIKGERGTARVETIGAGGYNIQCFHFRTLIHEVKQDSGWTCPEDLGI